ncbi:MAG: hypothetical protein JBO36_11595 [Candidatus Thiodiazotropha taylori]|nr:hypothetical protein [Candidatus Thiodiazotropha taylori]MCG7971290.1 hypothetical protein [Candidatus Thiodiazotropha taylori]
MRQLLYRDNLYADAGLALWKRRCIPKSLFEQAMIPGNHSASTSGCSSSQKLGE